MDTFTNSIHAFSYHIEPTKISSVGSLQGYTFAVKDVFEIKGLRMQAGNPEFLQYSKPAEETAPAVMTLQKAGASLVGKTHTDELGGSLFGINKHYGTPLNHKFPDRVPGGSSSGSTAAVAAGLVDFALGADTSGSVRAPASFCGIYGFRPTIGRIPIQGILPISEYLDTVGILANDPKLILQVLTVYGIKERYPFKRLRFIPSLFDRLQDPFRSLFHNKVRLLEDHVGASAPLLIEEEQLAQWRQTIRTIAMYGLWQTHKEWILSANPEFGDIIQDRINLARMITYEDFKKALNQREAIRSFMQNSVERGDLIVFPTVHDRAPLLSFSKEELNTYALNAACHTCISALTGFPELTIPLENPEKSGSIGLSFVGQADDDYALNLLASQLISPIEKA